MTQQDLLVDLNERFSFDDISMQKAKKKVFHDMIVKHKSVDNPQFMIIGGQAGCRKTEISDRVFQGLQKNAVLISMKNLSIYHPHIKTIKAEFPDMIQLLTADFVRVLLTYIENIAIQEKLNFVIEASLSNINSVVAKINKFKDNNYKIGLSIVALNKMVSYINAEETYEKTLLVGKNGYLVSKQYHDQHYEEIAVTLQKLETKNILDKVAIYKNKLHQNGGQIIATLTILEENKIAFVDAYIRERNRDFTEMELTYLREKAQNVKSMKANRDAYFLEKIRFDFNVKSLMEDKITPAKLQKLKTNN